jgi:AsmA family protein
MPTLFSRPMFRTFWITLLLLLISLGACELAGWPFLRAPAQQFLSEKLERKIVLTAPFELHLLGGLYLRAGGLNISAPEAFKVPHFVDVKEAELRLRYRDLLKLKPGDAYRIKSLRVEEIDARVLRNKDGVSTWQFKKDDQEPPRPFPIFENLVIHNGTAVVRDALSQADLDLRFNTQEGTEQTATRPASAAMQSTVDIEGKLRQEALRGHLVTSGFLPIASLKENNDSVRSKGWVEYGGLRADFDGQVADALGEQSIKGTLTVKGPSLSLFGHLVSTVLPTTAPFTLTTRLQKEGGLWLADVTSAHVGSSDLTGKFKYDLRPETPLLTGDIRGKRFVLADLGPAFGTASEAEASPGAPRTRAIPDKPLNLPALNKMDARISLLMDYVDLGAAFQRPIAPLRAALQLEKGKLGLADIDARTADGSLSGMISVDASKLNGLEADVKKLPPEAIPVWHADLTWKNIDLYKWLKISQTQRENARKENRPEPQPYLTGTLNGRAKLDGKGQTTAELLGSLDGNIFMTVRDGSVSHLIVEALGLDIAQALGVMIQGDSPVPLQCAVIDMQATHGILSPRVGLMDTPVTRVLTDGHIDMGKEALDLRLVAKPKNVSPLTVRSPIHVQGSFLQPEVNIEKTPIALRVVGGIALGLINPLAAILPFIDPGNGQQASCADVLQQLKQESASGKTSAR